MGLYSIACGVARSQLLFSCSYDDSIKMWAEDDGEWSCAETLSGHTSSVWEMAFNASGTRLGMLRSTPRDSGARSRSITHH